MKCIFLLFICFSVSAQVTPFNIGTSAFLNGTTTAFTNAPSAGGDITTGLLLHEVLATSAPDFTLVNSPTFSANAIHFTAASSQLGYLTIPQQWPQTALTVSIWINPTDPTATYSLPQMYNTYSGSFGTAYSQLFLNAGGVQARMHNGTDGNYIGQKTADIHTSLTGPSLITMVWTGVTASTGVLIYTNGVQDTATSDDSLGTFASPYAGSDLPISIGAQLIGSSSGSSFFDGSMWGLYVFNRALTPADIALLKSTGN